MGRLYIYLHEWLVLMGSVGKYTVRPMDGMGDVSCKHLKLYRPGYAKRFTNPCPLEQWSPVQPASH